MSTTEVTSWSTELANIGPIYPFVGNEVLFWILGLAFWLGFHIWQMRFESRTYKEDMERLSRPSAVEEAMVSRRLP